MPCYLFTWHGYGTWLPDRDRGFVHRGEGFRAKSIGLAQAYAKQQAEDAVTFTSETQRTILTALQEGTVAIEVRLHGVGTDPTHVHALISWRSDRAWQSIRRSLRSTLTRHLNCHHGKRTWLAKTGSRKRVTTQKHFDHLMKTYLPDHRGLCWFEVDATQR